MIKDLDFVYRESLPKNPREGVFYWIGKSDGVDEIWFSSGTDSNGLICLNASADYSIISNMVKKMIQPFDSRITLVEQKLDDISDLDEIKNKLKQLEEISTKVGVIESDYVKSKDISDFIKQNDLEGYVKSNELELYVKTEDISNYITSSELDDFIKLDDLKNYVTKDDISGFIQSSELELYLKKDELSGYVTKDDISGYVQSSELDLYVKTDELSNYIQSSELGQYVKLDDIQDYIKSSDLTDFVKNETLNLYVKSEDLKDYINSSEFVKSNELSEILTGYATKDDLDTFARLEDIPDFDISDFDLSHKQDVLISGLNIKTINGQSLLGEGNINIEDSDEDVKINLKWFDY